MPINKPEDFDKDDDIEKRKPKPFRYLKNDESIHDHIIKLDEDKTFTLMTTNRSKIELDYNNQVVLSNNKNIGKVEEIIKKHEEIRKIKDYY